VSWDVINGMSRSSLYAATNNHGIGTEPFNDDGTFRESVFFTTTGTSYIATALIAARAADPAAKLYVCLIQ
jgi:GH35 family endo-1,4-beta-xylanase